MMADKTTPGGVPVGASVQVGGMPRPVLAAVRWRVDGPGPSLEVPAGIPRRRMGRRVSTPIPLTDPPHTLIDSSLGGHLV